MAARTKKITKYGQQILDLICDRVVSTAGMGFVGWSIGNTDVVVDAVAKTLGKTRHSVAGALAHLIDADLVISGGETDDDERPKQNILGLSHDGWQTYSRWDATKIVAHNGSGTPPEPISLEDWLEWDGVDFTRYPFDGPPLSFE